MLGIVEDCVPGRDLREKLGVLGREGLWLELANRGPRDLSDLELFNVEVRTVQAYLLHDYSLVSPDPDVREAAMRHIKETIELASSIGASNVLVVPGYGFDFCPAPERPWLELMGEAADHAEGLGVQILVESLGPKRTAFAPSLSGVASLVERLDHPAVHLMADTMQVYNSGEDVYAALERYAQRLKEVQLRDTGSKPPGRGKLDFRRIAEICRGIPLCLEYTPENVGEDFRWAVGFLKGLTGGQV
jgi:sugar phosphate isomerase/epimerase